MWCVRAAVSRRRCSYASYTDRTVLPTQRQVLKRNSVTTADCSNLRVDLAVFPEWILRNDDDLLVINKPGWLVCHPSKNGPLSSLVGAAREYTGLETLHLVARLDRETSGLVLFAKRPAVARRYQMAIQDRRVRKAYLAILEGELGESVKVKQSIARRKRGSGPVFAKNEVRCDAGAKTAVTTFTPLATRGGYTLAQVEPHTGRQHQIRVHAEWLDHRVVGDKVYGPDETLFLEFIENGWTSRLDESLPLRRQALHSYRYVFEFRDRVDTLIAPFPADLQTFCTAKMGLESVLSVLDSTLT